MKKVLYREEQKFAQLWPWLIIIPCTLVSTVPFMYGIYLQEVLRKPWGTHPSTVSLVSVLVFNSALMAGIILLIAKIKLVVEIRQDGIRYKYLPIIRKWRVIGKAEIKNYKVRKYYPVTEYLYGGWVLIGRNHNKVYNGKGNTGLQIYLQSGKSILFGIQKQQALEHAMQKLMEKED